MPQVLEQLLQLLLKASTERLEALLLAKELDQLGALQLDRDSPYTNPNPHPNPEPNPEPNPNLNPNPNPNQARSSSTASCAPSPRCFTAFDPGPDP